MTKNMAASIAMVALVVFCAAYWGLLTAIHHFFGMAGVKATIVIGLIVGGWMWIRIRM